MILPCLLLYIPLLLFLLAHAGRRPRSRSNRLPPGPRPLPIVGNLHQVGAAPQVSLTALAAEHGPLMFLRLGSVPTLVISSADAACEAVSHHDVALAHRPKHFAVEKLSYGLRDMIFAPIGEHWRQARRLVTAELLSPKRVQSFRTVREEEVARLVASIRDESSSTAAIDLSRKMLVMANSVVCRAAFGDKYGEGDGVDLHRILAEAQHVQAGFSTADCFPWMGRWIKAIDGTQVRVEKVFKELDAVYTRMIEAHRKQTPSSEEDADMVDVLLRLHEDPIHRKTFHSVDHIKALIMNIFIAGTDTAAASVVWTMTRLMKHPQVMSRVQKEIRDTISNQGEVKDPDRQNLHYLKLVINETFRLHPPVPLVPRETISDIIIRGYQVPEKTRVFFNAKAIGRDSVAWGDDALDFSPERFLNREIDYKGNYFEFIPFGAGRRICPGISFGMAIVELTLANLLYHFEWELPPGMSRDELDFEEAFGITMHKKTPLCLVAKPYNIRYN